MSYLSEREHERFRALLRRAATEDFRLLHPDRDGDWFGSVRQQSGIDDTRPAGLDDAHTKARP